MEAVRIEAMGGQECADALVAEVARERASAARRLLLVGQWAVLHGPETVAERRDAAGRVLPGTERARGYGGAGTPPVAEFAVHELALLLGLPEPVARGELADVLDLTHRHPQLWARVVEAADGDAPGRDPAAAAGMVQAWQARHVARRCRHARLSADAARWVDARTTRHLGTQAWSRFCDLLEARIKAADPALAEQRRRANQAGRRVTVSRTNAEGMKALTVLLPAAQIIVLRARIHQLARCLQTRAGQATAPTPLAALEAEAAFLLCTNPLDALHLLLQAATKHAQPAAGAEPDPDADPGVDPDVDPENGPGAEPDGGCGAQPGPGSGSEPAAGPAGAPAPDPDDPRHLFDDRPVKDWEGGPPPADPPADPPAPDPPAQDPAASEPDPGGLVPESAIHPSQHDPRCPTCGHDPTRPPGHRPALSMAELPDLDPARLRPPVVLYLHAPQQEFRGGLGLVRCENDGVAFTHAEAIALLGHAQVRITRVVDLNDHRPVDAYEIPDPLAERVRLAYPSTVSPFSATGSRGPGVDLDHADPYLPPSAGGPAGQTRLDNLAPLARGAHRVKTHGRGWTTRHPRFGVHLWRTPHGYCFQRDAYGTTPLGKMTHAEFTQYTHELAEQEAWDQDACEEGA